VSSGRAALELCRQRPPGGIILDVKLPDLDGWQVMEELRRDPLTASIPVHFVSAAAGAERALELGAIGYLTKPATRQDLSRVVEALAGRSSDPSRRILLVEHAADPGDSLGEQLIAQHFEVTRATSAKEALSALTNQRFLCAILDLALPDMSGLEFLQAMREQCGPHGPAVVAYSARPLSKAETKSLEAYAEAIVLKEGSSSERLLDEVQLFVRRLKSGIRHKAPSLTTPNVRLEGKRVLIVDDDMRTVYALSATLRAKGADVLVADTGHAALGVLAQQTHVDAVLMDIMMPELDGYETMRRIRQDHRLDSLPIIALTAKAMKGDRDRCLEVGASDYLPKPIDPERLLAMLHEKLTSSMGVGNGGTVNGGAAGAGTGNEGGHAS
jgi:CheY-like chemotaxis protein